MKDGEYYVTFLVDFCEFCINLLLLMQIISFQRGRSGEI